MAPPNNWTSTDIRLLSLNLVPSPHYSCTGTNCLMFTSLQMKPDSNCFDSFHNTFIRFYQLRVICDKHCVTERIIEPELGSDFWKVSTSFSSADVCWCAVCIFSG